MSETSRYPEIIVGALLVNPQGQILVARYSKITGRYAIPGGHVEYGETAAQALVRELEEETGLTPTGFRLLQVSERIRPPLYKDGRHHLVYLDFVVDEWRGALQLDGVELSAGKWLRPQDALTLPLTYTTRRLVEYYIEVGSNGPARYRPDDGEGG
ncbi:MAG TPA: NUDIX domain-containing protein [Thermoflexia bacterium]|nr:NUDIX domain-containing protein [Thermoflexia bacterium]